MIQISLEQFALMAPRLHVSKRVEVLAELNRCLDEFQIGKTVFRAAAFVSNLLHESNQFSWTSEIWGPTPAQQRYEPVFDAAGKVINRKAIDLGNFEKGDGYKRRGLGWIQTTGGKNQRRVFTRMGEDPESDPEKLRQPRYAAKAAGIFWTDNNLSRLADCLTGERDANETKTLRAVCRRINGGYNGFDDRVKYYWRVLSILRGSVAAKKAVRNLTDSLVASNRIPEISTAAGAAALAPAELVPNSAEVSIAAREQIAQAREAANISEESALDVANQQEQATALIDYAEAVSPAQARAAAARAKQTLGEKILAWGAWAFGLLKAGDVSAWLVVTLVVVAVAYLAWTQRKTLKRWKAIGTTHFKEWVFTEPVPAA